jgi:hypothetical protein
MNSRLELYILNSCDIYLVGEPTVTFSEMFIKEIKKIKQIKNTEKQICPITFEKILENENYMNCIICTNNFSEPALKKWFLGKSTKTCPCCRIDWIDFDVYTNKNPDT